MYNILTDLNLEFYCLIKRKIIKNNLKKLMIIKNYYIFAIQICHYESNMGKVIIIRQY